MTITKNVELLRNLEWKLLLCDNKEVKEDISSLFIEDFFNDPNSSDFDFINSKEFLNITKNINDIETLDELEEIINNNMNSISTNASSDLLEIKLLIIFIKLFNFYIQDNYIGPPVKTDQIFKDLSTNKVKILEKQIFKYIFLIF